MPLLGLVVDKAEESLWVEGIAIETSQSEKQREQNWEKQKKIFKDGGPTMTQSHVWRIPEEEEKREGTEKILETVMTKHFFQMNVDTKW
jgi:hypothetical protein